MRWCLSGSSGRLFKTRRKGNNMKYKIVQPAKTVELDLVSVVVDPSGALLLTPKEAVPGKEYLLSLAANNWVAVYGTAEEDDA